MAGFNDTNLGGLILNVYSREKIQRLQNLESPLLGKIRTAGESLGGNGFIFGVNTSGNEAIGFRDPNGALPSAGTEAVQQATVSPRAVYAAVAITGLAKALATGGNHSFANVVTYQLDEVRARVTAYINGALYRTNTNILALVNESSPSGTTLDIDTPGALWLREGMNIDFFTSAGAYHASSSISQVDWNANQIVTSEDVSASLSNNDVIVLSGEQSTSAGSLSARSFDGLPAGCATSGSYLSLSRSTYPRWRGNSISASSANIDEDLLYQAVIRAAQEGGFNPSSLSGDWALLMHFNQVRKLAEVVYPRQRFGGGSTELGGMPSAFMGLSIMSEPFCPETTVYGGDLGVFQKFVTPNGDLQISTDFGDPWKFTPGFDAGSAYLREYSNYVVRNPRRMFEITSLADVTNR